MSYCCEMMRDNVESSCDMHPDRYDCPDCLIDRYKDGRFGIMIHDGGQGHITIKYCPWCGADLRKKRFSLVTWMREMWVMARLISYGVGGTRRCYRV